jgi:WD40 repeat protein
VVAAGGDGKLSIIDALDFRLLHSLKLSAQKLRCLCLSENEQLLLTGGSDGFIRMLDTAYLNELESVKAHDGGVYAIHQLTDGRYVSGGRDAHLRFWEWKEGRLLQVNAVPAHNYAIYAISSVRGSTFFASASRDKTAKVWDLDNLNAPSRLFRKGDKGHTHSVNTCAFSPDGELLVTAGDDSKIILWKPSTE